MLQALIGPVANLVGKFFNTRCMSKRKPSIKQNYR